MSSFFSSGRVDTSKVDRAKLPAGPNNTQAVYRVRLTDACDHLQATAGDRSQFGFVVSAGPMTGKSGAELVMHAGYQKSWQTEKARGTIATVLGAFAGFSRDQAGFKVDNDFFAKNTRSVTYNGNSVASKTRDAEELPLVKANAECFLVVSPYFDKKTHQRKVNPKTGALSVLYEFVPLSAGLEISNLFEGKTSDTDEETPDAPADDEPAVDALALALADGWKPNGTSGFFYKKGEAKQHKEGALRALYTK